MVTVKDTERTCAMHLLSRESDVERVGGVSPAGQTHAQLEGRNGLELSECLAEHTHDGALPLTW